MNMPIASFTFFLHYVMCLFLNHKLDLESISFFAGTDNARDGESTSGLFQGLN